MSPSRSPRSKPSPRMCRRRRCCAGPSATRRRKSPARSSARGCRGRPSCSSCAGLDFTTLTRQTTLSIATNQESVIAATALHLFAQTWHAALPVRLMGVGVSGLSSGVAGHPVGSYGTSGRAPAPGGRAAAGGASTFWGARHWRGREWKQAQEGRLRNGHGDVNRLASADAGEAF